MAVKISQSVGVLWKMGRYPVQDHANAVFVEVIYKIHKLLRCAVSGGGSKIPGDLIPPGAVIRVFCDPHQLHMSIAHFPYVGCQLVSRLDICITAILFFPVFFSPGAKMDFVDTDGTLCHIRMGTGGDPFVIAPGKA